jgi:hypothetical protein
MSSAASPPPRGLIALLAFAFAAYLGWALYLSIGDILSLDDFEVFHFIGSVASQRGSNIYELTTPHQQRGPFLYPPSAAALFVPLSWMGHDPAGVLFSIVKIACLAGLWLGSIWFSGRRPADISGLLLCAIGPLIMLHRTVHSDVGNGQINLMVAMAAVGGVWLIMLGRRGGWWLGSMLLAWSIAIKLTPALLLAVLLLNRRWRALAATLTFAVLLLVALPAVWFGPEAFGRMTGQYREIAARFTFDWASPYEQTTPTELFQFARLQNGDATTTPADSPDELVVPISGYAGERLFEPRYRPPANWFWLAVGCCSGLAYLGFRHFLLRRRWLPGGADWTWDLAMLCSLMVFLSPRVQKAHLVILIVPAGWLAARVCNWFAPGAMAAGARRPLMGLICYCLLCAMFLVGDSAKIPVPGWSEPARCVPLMALSAMIMMVAAVGWLDASTHDGDFGAANRRMAK